MQRIADLSGGDDFPPSSEALDYPDGLLAAGGELSCERLLAAYRRGIFPWYEEPQPVLWWTPDPRSILLPEELHISRSLRRTLRRNRFRLALDQRFPEVMAACAQLRGDGLGTWIGDDMLSAYSELHRRGFAHSVEVLDDAGRLVGGLYGVAIGAVFFGESMFSLEADASKVALAALVHTARRGGIRLTDCQVQSDHLDSLGARSIPRLDFEQLLAHTIDIETRPGTWTLPESCGDLP